MHEHNFYPQQTTCCGLLILLELFSIIIFINNISH